MALVACTASAQDAKPAAAPTPMPTPTPMPMPAQPPATDFSKIFKDDKEKIGYAIGMYAASIKDRLKSQDIEYDTDMLIKGFTDSVTTGTTTITQEQKMEVLKDLDKQIRTKMQEKQKQQAEENRIKGEKNKADGAAFLDKNKAQAGVITLPDGLQYKIITEGTGAIPKGQDEVSVNYRGTLLDGTEFDSSYKRNQPFSTKVEGGIIKGWTEALELMKTGSKWQIFVPSDLAYGPAGRSGIPPNAVLIFEIELLSTKEGTAAARLRTHPLRR